MKRSIADTPPLKLPRYMNLDEALFETTDFFDSFRRRAIVDDEWINLKFSELESISLPAALILVAEIDRWTKIKHIEHKVTYYNDCQEHIAAFLTSMGFFDLLGQSVAPAPIYVPNGQCNSSVTFLPYRTGGELNSEVCQNARDLSLQMRDADRAISQLYGGLIEVMENAASHAYPEHFEPRFTWLPNRWWMCGLRDRNQQTFTAAVFDQGVGIPYTVHQKISQLDLRHDVRHANFTSDAKSIENAFRLHKWFNANDHKPRGLKCVMDVMDAVENSSLRVVSRYGDVRYERENGYRSNPLLRNLNRSIGGTLVQWELQL